MGTEIIMGNYEEYIFSIKERALKLIHFNIWSGIQRAQLKRWMCQFVSQEEQLLMAFLLDTLIYRTNNQLKSLITQHFLTTIPNIFVYFYKNQLNFSPYKILTQFQSDSTPEIYLVIVDNDPINSSQYVLNFMKKELEINEKFIIKSSDIENVIGNNKTQNFIFIDDLAGTGDQFCEFSKDMIWEEQSEMKNCRIIYAPLVLHEKGFLEITDKYPHIKVRSTEFLREEHNFFNKFSIKGDLNRKRIKQIYNDYLKSKEITTRTPYGYGGLSLTYIFEGLATPDNSLPILWTDSGSYRSLFPRNN